MLASKRILIVEDDAGAVAMLSAHLRALGCEVTGVVAGAEEAAVRAVAELPSAVMVNLVLVAGSPEGIEGVRRRFAMPVVFVAPSVALGHAAGLRAVDFVTGGAGVREVEMVLSAAFGRVEIEQRVQDLEGMLAEERRYGDVGRVAGEIAHKFNNLLMGVTSGAALVRFDLPEVSPGHENIDRIEEAVQQAAVLCQQILASVRRDQDRQLAGMVEPGKGRQAGAVKPLRGISGAVLIVDDDDAVRALASWVVEKAGYAAVAASDGDEAMARFREDPGAFGLVLLDLTMPRMSGEEVLMAMRAIRPNIPVVVITGYGEDAVRESERAGIAAFLQKPFSPDALRAVLLRCAADPERGG